LNYAINEWKIILKIQLKLQVQVKLKIHKEFKQGKDRCEGWSTCKTLMGQGKGGKSLTNMGIFPDMS